MGVSSFVKGPCFFLCFFYFSCSFFGWWASRLRGVLHLSMCAAHAVVGFLGADDAVYTVRSAFLCSSSFPFQMLLPYGRWIAIVSLL